MSCPFAPLAAIIPSLSALAWAFSLYIRKFLFKTGSLFSEVDISSLAEKGIQASNDGSISFNIGESGETHIEFYEKTAPYFRQKIADKILKIGNGEVLLFQSELKSSIIDSLLLELSKLDLRRAYIKGGDCLVQLNVTPYVGREPQFLSDELSEFSQRIRDLLNV